MLPPVTQPASGNLLHNTGSLALCEALDGMLEGPFTEGDFDPSSDNSCPP